MGVGYATQVLDPLKQQICADLFDHAPASMVSFHAEDRQIVMANGSFCTMTSLSGDGAASDITLDNVWPELVSALLPLLETMHAGHRGVKDAPLTVQRPSLSGGDLVHLRCDMRIIFDESGLAIIIAVLHEVTVQVEEHRRLERAAAAEIAKLQCVAGHLEEGIAMLDLSRNLTYLNPSALNILGLTDPKQVDGTDERYPHISEVFECLSPDGMRTDVDVAFEPITKALSGMYSVGEFELCRLESGFCRYLTMSGAPIWGPDGEVIGAVLVFRDVSDAKRHERELADLLDSKDRFLSMAAHELKTPLTVLLGNLQLLVLRDRDLAGVRRAHLFETLILQCKKLDRLTDDLLDFSRLISGHLAVEEREFDIGSLVAAVVEEKRRMHPANRWALKSVTLCNIKGDASRLEQVLSNLTSNAVKYSPPGSTIEVGSELRGDTIRVWITDEGQGIADEDLCRIFDLYYRSSAVRGDTPAGLGLGLYISREIVGLHGGEIQVTSALGKGSTFTVVLPAFSEAAPDRY